MKLGTSPVFIKTLRDVLIFEFDRGRHIVVGCDSAGGVGPKPLDKVKVDGYTLGRFTARVALTEVLCTGAKPICLVNTVSVEPKPTGDQIVKGIKDEARRAGLDPSLAVTGSSEKNVPVEQTGLGVTVIGTVLKDELKIGLSRRNDAVVAIGTPCTGREVVSAEKKRKIADLDDVLRLLALNSIHDIIPVGSRGILHEARTIAEESHLRFELADRPKVDVKKSAGPATVILASLPSSELQNLLEDVDKPINLIGNLL